MWWNLCNIKFTALIIFRCIVLWHILYSHCATALFFIRLLTSHMRGPPYFFWKELLDGDLWRKQCMLEFCLSFSVFSFGFFLEQMVSANCCRCILYSDSFKLAAIAEVCVFGLRFNRPPPPPTPWPEMWIGIRHKAGMGRWYNVMLISKSWQNNININF